MTTLAEPVCAISDLSSRIAAICRLIPPAWPLRDLVAVNPYLGCAAQDPLAVEALLQRRWGAAAIPAWPHLSAAWQAGEFTQEDLLAVLAGPQRPTDAPAVAEVVRALESPAWPVPDQEHCRSTAAQLPAGTWQSLIQTQIGRFLAGRYDQGIARWAPAAQGELYAEWLAWAQIDRSLEVAGLPGARAWFASLPATADAALAELLATSGVPESGLDDYCGALLGELPGWAGALRQRAWHPVEDAVGELPALLAVRMAYDAALRALLPDAPLPAVPPARPAAALVADRAGRLSALLAWEHAWRRQVVGLLRPVAAVAPPRPAVQAVFCIDVRSEPLRRHLERADPAIETYGFAGFFAMTIAQQHGGERQDQCPVLLAPAVAVALPAAAARPLIRLTGSVRRSGGGGFAYMESLGLTHAWSLAKGALGLAVAPVRPAETAPLGVAAIPPETRLAMLKGMLANLGLRAPYARLVVLCGHDSTVVNNPQSAGLACGACGGHSGALNARLAAALYNDPGLRAQLGAASLPEDSWAVAAVHDTATDEVRVLDAGLVPASHQVDLEAFTAAGQRAGAGLRQERAPSLPGCPQGAADDQLAAAIGLRSRDWAEVRPEWALADNAAFIAAPRPMTLASNLHGRSFLHSYDAALDPSGAVLGLILTAPVIVASWINLQYYASAIDPQHLGSGSKLLHNVVGGIGVTTGGDGDLKVGLAWQSVHDGQRLRHRPVRLQVFVAASRTAIDGVIAGHQHLRDLVSHGWISVHALDQATAQCWWRSPVGGWVAVSG
jgi:uncharacterized protein YbcC (UPF0753/DUF2309 family)